MKYRRLVLYGEYIFVIDEEVQGPDRYSVFLAENLRVRSGESVLDLCTGTGFLAVVAARSAARVVAIDLQPQAVRCARRNTILNGVDRVVEVREGDLFGGLKTGEQFDVIISWPPVLPSAGRRERTDWFGVANEGGPDGRRVVERIVGESSRYLRPGGRLQLLLPWYIDVGRTKAALAGVGFRSIEETIGEFPVGVLSFERREVVEGLGFRMPERGGVEIQRHYIITAVLE